MDFKTHAHTSWGIFRHTPFKRAGCVAFSLARGLADDPADEEEVSMLAAEVSTVLKEDPAVRWDEKRGVHYGRIEWACRAVGFEGEQVLFQRDTSKPVWTETANGGMRWTGRNALPTVAQVVRDLGIAEGFIRCTGHVGYVRDGKAYCLGARARVDHVFILRRKA